MLQTQDISNLVAEEEDNVFQNVELYSPVYYM